MRSLHVGLWVSSWILKQMVEDACDPVNLNRDCVGHHSDYILASNFSLVWRFVYGERVVKPGSLTIDSWPRNRLNRSVRVANGDYLRLEQKNVPSLYFYQQVQWSYWAHDLIDPLSADQPSLVFDIVSPVSNIDCSAVDFHYVRREKEMASFKKKKKKQNKWNYFIITAICIWPRHQENAKQAEVKTLAVTGFKDLKYHMEIGLKWNELGNNHTAVMLLEGKCRYILSKVIQCEVRKFY
jgi:hypothetical protein